MSRTIKAVHSGGVRRNACSSNSMLCWCARRFGRPVHSVVPGLRRLTHKRSTSIGRAPFASSTCLLVVLRIGRALAERHNGALRDQPLDVRPYQGRRELGCHVAGSGPRPSTATPTPTSPHRSKVRRACAACAACGLRGNVGAGSGRPGVAAAGEVACLSDRSSAYLAAGGSPLAEAARTCGWNYSAPVHGLVTLGAGEISANQAARRPRGGADSCCWEWWAHPTGRSGAVVGLPFWAPMCRARRDSHTPIQKKPTAGPHGLRASAAGAAAGGPSVSACGTAAAATRGGHANTPLCLRIGRKEQTRPILRA